MVAMVTTLAVAKASSVFGDMVGTPMVRDPGTFRASLWMSPVYGTAVAVTGGQPPKSHLYNYTE